MGNLQLRTPAEIDRPSTTATLDEAAGWRAPLRPLRIRNFRIFLIGQVFSNIGAWVQRIAQDWLVLTLTGSATAVGVTTALQLLPTLLLGPVGGLIADRHPKRRVLLATQAALASTAAVLTVLTLTHQVQVWHIYLLAALLGVVIAVDKPTQQALVTEMVGSRMLRAAVSLHSSVFQFGGLVGPAVSGVLIYSVGTGYSFGINALSFVPPVLALWLIRDEELDRPDAAAGRRRGQLRGGMCYALGRKDAVWPIVLAGVFGLFTTNLPITLAAYARTVFESGASGYALLNTVVAVGALSGALISARYPVVKLRSIVTLALLLAGGYVVASLAPNLQTFCALLVVLGASTALLLASASSTVQLAADGGVRGRVIGFYLMVFVGCGAVGGPILGFVTQSLGPHVGMLISGLVPGLATLWVAWKLARLGRLRVRLRTRRGWSRLVIVPR